MNLAVTHHNYDYHSTDQVADYPCYDRRLLVELRRSLLETHELVARSHSLMGGDPHSPLAAIRSASPVPAAGTPSKWRPVAVPMEAERAMAEAAAASAADAAAEATEAAAAAEASVAAAVRRAVGATVPAAVEASVAEAMHAAVAAALQDALPTAVNAAVSAAVREATHLEPTDAHMHMPHAMRIYSASTVHASTRYERPLTCRQCANLSRRARHRSSLGKRVAFREAARKERATRAARRAGLCR